MGWCSATEIIDAALDAADALMAQVAADLPASEVDAILRPFVRRIADKLRDNDWDCQEDSPYFDRFAQEMLGHDDGEHAEWLAERIADFSDDPDKVIALAEQLRAIRKRMNADGH